MTALIGLLVPEGDQPGDDVIATVERAEWVLAHDAPLPDPVGGEAVTQQLAIALVVAPPVAVHPLGDVESVEHAAGLAVGQPADAGLSGGPPPARLRLKLPYLGHLVSRLPTSRLVDFTDQPSRPGSGGFGSIA